MYLVKARGFSTAGMAQLGAGIYVAYAATSVLTGRGSDRWLMAGATANRARKTAVIAGLAGLAACLTVCGVAGPTGSLVALAGCVVCLGFTTPTIFAIAQTLAGPAAAARWMGVQNFLGNLAGITAPVITGIAIDRTDSFSVGFIIAAALAVVGIFAYGIIVRGSR